MRRQLLAEQLMNFLFCGNQVNRETSQTMAVRPASLYKKKYFGKVFFKCDSVEVSGVHWSWTKLSPTVEDQT